MVLRAKNSERVESPPTEGELNGKRVFNHRAVEKERDRVAKQLKGMDAAITAFAAVYNGAKPVRKRKKISLAGRKRIAAAQRARWAKVRAKKS